MTPLGRAEQAVLGAVLLEPAQLDDLDGWLQPEHFYQSEHAALYQALLDARADRRPGALTSRGEPVPLEWATDAADQARRTAPAATTPYVLHLASRCPRPRHAPAYGRMVLEAAIHRTVSEHATRLQQAARADAARGDSLDTRHFAKVLDRTLHDLATAWGTEPTATPPPDGVVWATSTPLPATTEQLADEQWLLTCLTATQSGPFDVFTWLRPDDFAGPGHQQIYRCLAALHHRAEPVDEITVLWEAQRRGYLTAGADGILDTDRVMQICGAVGVPQSAPSYGEQTVQAALVRQAHVTAEHIQHLAQQDLPPGQLIGYALHSLQAAEAVRRRWQAATGERQPHLDQPAPGSDPPREMTAAARARSHPDARAGPPTPHLPTHSAPPQAPRRSPAP